MTPKLKTLTTTGSSWVTLTRSLSTFAPMTLSKLTRTISSQPLYKLKSSMEIRQRKFKKSLTRLRGQGLQPPSNPRLIIYSTSHLRSPSTITVIKEVRGSKDTNKIVQMMTCTISSMHTMTMSICTEEKHKLRKTMQRNPSKTRSTWRQETKSCR